MTVTENLTFAPTMELLVGVALAYRLRLRKHRPFQNEVEVVRDVCVPLFVTRFLGYKLL